MIATGIVLLVIGAAVAWLAGGRIEQLGYIVAVVGVALIVIGALLGLADGADGDRVDGALLLPLAAWQRLRARLG